MSICLALLSRVFQKRFCSLETEKSFSKRLRLCQLERARSFRASSVYNLKSTTKQPEIVRGNYEPYREVLWRDVKIEDEREYLKQVWQPRLKPFGAFKNAESIGTDIAENSQVLYVLLNFERGSRIVRFHRNGEGRFFLNTDQVPILPPLYRFVSVSKTDFAAFNFATGMEVKISFPNDKPVLNAFVP